MAPRAPSSLLLTLAAAAFLVFSLVASPTRAWSQDDASVLERFAFTGASHAAFGRALGERFRDKIHARARANVKLQTRLLPFVQKTPQGREVYAQFLATHEKIFPGYVEELRGISEGSGLAFETVFVMNLSEEFDDAVPADLVLGSAAAAKRKTLRCSDIVLVGGPEQLRVVAHNEDADVADLNHSAIVIAQIGDQPKFVAFTYLGDLPSGAFGYNDRGVGFTLNFVQPAETETGGLGRGFISRDLLWATDIDDAFRRITRPRQASGHNYQLMDIANARIWNVEAAALNRFASQELLAPLNASDVRTFYHANQYQLLEIAQPPYQSSLHRLKRFSELPRATTVTDALTILGDQHDRLWPVYHDALSHEKGELSGWTLTTIVFDLVKKQAISYRGNPSKQRKEFVWDLVNLTVDKVTDEPQATA